VEGKRREYVHSGMNNQENLRISWQDERGGFNYKVERVLGERSYCCCWNRDNKDISLGCSESQIWITWMSLRILVKRIYDLIMNIFLIKPSTDTNNVQNHMLIQPSSITYRIEMWLGCFVFKTGCFRPPLSKRIN
jgi:hypothetical protein